MKKTKRSTGSSGKGQSAHKAGKKPVGTKPVGTKAARTPRIPVRGARKASDGRGASGGRGGRGGGGITERAAPAMLTRAARGNLDEVRSLALVAINAAIEKKALMPVLIDVSAMASYTDFIGIVSGRSDRQVDAIADAVRLAMKEHGRMTLGQEGTGNGRWTLLDFGSVVLHVFHHPVREFYDLESLWIEAPRVPLEIPAESRLSDADAFYSAM